VTSTVLQPNQPPSLGVWPHVRALLITCVLLVQTLSATPPQPLTAERLSRPEGARLVSWIESALAAIGMGGDRAAIERGLIDVTERAVALRGAVLAPFERVLQNLSSHQQWGLFLMSGGDYFRMHVEAQVAGGGFRTVYIAGELDRTGLEPALRYRRLRGIYNPSLRRGPSAEYDGFVTWLAGELWRTHPEYGALRVRMEHMQLSAAGSGPLDASGALTRPRSLGFEHLQLRQRPVER
jgi:hypothetical protein